LNRKSADEEFLFEGRGWKMILLRRNNESVGGGDYTFDLMKVIRVVSGDVK